MNVVYFCNINCVNIYIHKTNLNVSLQAEVERINEISIPRKWVFCNVDEVLISRVNNDGKDIL